MSLKKIMEEKELSTAELTVAIFDTLFKNTEYNDFGQFDPEKATDAKVEGGLGEITFDYQGVPIHIHIT